MQARRLVAGTNAHTVSDSDADTLYHDWHHRLGRSNTRIRERSNDVIVYTGKASTESHATPTTTNSVSENPFANENHKNEDQELAYEVELCINGKDYVLQVRISLHRLTSPPFPNHTCNVSSLGGQQRRCPRGSTGFLSSAWIRSTSSCALVTARWIWTRWICTL